MKRLKKVVLTVILISTICCAGFVFLLLSFMKDDSPPYDDDLRVTLTNITEGENAYYLFEKAIKKMYWPEQKKRIIYDILAGKKRDDAFVNELLERNEESFTYLYRVLSCDKFQYPAMAADELTEWLDYEHDYSLETVKLAGLWSIRAMYLFKQGREKKAFDEFFNIIELGQIIEGAHGDLTNYFVGLIVKKVRGLEYLQKISAEVTLSPEVLRGYIERLDDFKADQKGIVFAVKRDYMFQCEMIDQIMTPEIQKKVELKYKDFRSIEYVIFKVLGVFGYAYKPNKTKRMFAETYRPYIEKLKNPALTVEYSTWPEVIRKSSMVKLFFSENGVGKALYKGVDPDLQKILNAIRRENFFVKCTQLLLAAKCYKIETGKQIQSLDELVPRYVSELPQDFLNGGPIRYSKEKKTIYFAGGMLQESESENIEELKKEQLALSLNF